ncbi:hypothetical protein KFK09_017645 [Dendrobium nobile]|uniref:Response regulatory domain-containing protein n=1 Tax=Dendrobium nobile TaxID=94219 RepID=A0A8T3B3M7_DENNO|nr:hypothetical protein KFK09_017645 [Dendrobium nobile]
MSESEAMLPDGFPAGLRVFVVDEDSVALRMLEKMLLQCGYEGSVSSQQRCFEWLCFFSAALFSMRQFQ